jgi:hypothetical protein
MPEVFEVEVKFTGFRTYIVNGAENDQDAEKQATGMFWKEAPEGVDTDDVEAIVIDTWLQ